VRALILAAGLGTRLRPLTNRIPKCMVPIKGRPLLEYWLELLLKQGIERILINTHYLPEIVREYLRTSSWRDRADLVHEPELLGTGGTILRNRAYFGNEAFLVAHGDNLTRFDVTSFIQRHRQRPAGVEITMMTFQTDTPESCGIVVEDDHGRVTKFFEKVANPPGNRANGAVYIFEPSVIEFMAALDSEIVDLSTEVLPHFVGRIITFHNSDYHRDIGTLDSLMKAEREFSMS